MSGFAMNALQAAIFTALSGDPGLAGLGASVFDYAPPGASFPYVSIGENTAKDFDGCTFDGQESTLTIHSWAQGEGRKTVNTLMENIYRILHRASLTVTGQKLVLILCEFAQSELDPDGLTYHGVQRFRAITQGV